MITAHMRLNSKRDAMLWAAQTADLNDDQQSRVADWIWKNKPSIGCVYAEHPLADISSLTFWMIADGPRTNPQRKVRLSARHRFRELHDQSHNLRWMAREPGYFKTRAERAHALKTARMMRRHMYETPKTNPFRKLRPYKGGLTAAQLLDQAESRRESAALHRFSPTHRRHDLLWARTLRKKAYYTPKRRKKA